MIFSNNGLTGEMSGTCQHESPVFNPNFQRMAKQKGIRPIHNLRTTSVRRGEQMRAKMGLDE